MNLNKSFIFISAIVIFVMSGCASQSQKSGLPSSILFSGKEKISRAAPKQFKTDELIQEIYNANTQINSFKADLKLDFKDSIREKGNRFKCLGKIAIKKPYSLRLHGYNFIGGTMFDIVSDGNRFYFYLPQDGKVITGSSNNPTTAYHPAIRIRPNDILESFFFHDFMNYTKKNTCFYEYEPGYYILYVLKNESNQLYLDKKIWVNDKTFDIVRHQSFSKEKEVTFDVTISSFFDFADKGSFPKKIEIVRPLSHLDLIMEFSSVNLEPNLNERVFKFEIPKNIETVNAD